MPRTRASRRSHRTRASTGAPGTGAPPAPPFETHPRPGALHSAIAPLAERGIDMVQLVSRPIPSRPFDYPFDCVLGGLPPAPDARDAARGMNGTGAGMGGWRASVIAASSSVRSPFRKLQGAQAVTTFSQTES